ncbi:MAG: DUF4276 family protein [Clostridiaceae bacterium]|jgi:hypothetical protein|nr:DUF4276 family protein [Bacillota bacterium]NLN52227.1 DUF4276 family protein [Clostridiaceae bacterium]
MIIEVLSEDKSSVPVLEQIFSELLFDYSDLVNKINIYPHRGKGKLPTDLKQKPKAFASSLLDLLPAKIRAYNQIYQNQDIILVVVLDADQDDKNDLYQNIEHVLRKEAPNKFFVIGIPIEETEAWLLGDRKALFAAYPDARKSILENYEQDSICGTWEILARVIMGTQAEQLIKVGYPAVGTYKHIWAEKISQNMRINNNLSKSFHEFIRRFRTVLDWALEGR